jgi:hypothetical protein
MRGPVLLRLRFRYVSKAPFFVIAHLTQRSEIKVLLEFQGLDHFAHALCDGFSLWV